MSKICAIVSEYNPFHKGHMFHIEETKKKLGCDVIVTIMSSNFMQRGEPSILSKQHRVETILENGVDVVIELPFIFAVQGADLFAKSAIKIVNKLDVDYLSFGSETGNKKKFEEKYKNVLNKKIDYKKIKKRMKKGISFPKAFDDLYLKDENIPNDVLGINYIKNLKKSIKWFSLKRTTSYHSNHINKISSASAIRKAFKENKDISDQTPLYLKMNEKPNGDLNNLFDLLKYKLLVTNKDKLSKIHLVNEGIENLFIENIKKSKSMEEFIKKCSNKRYTYSRIRRTILFILLDIEKKYAKKLLKHPERYIRILGFNKKGKSFLRTRKSKANFISKFNKFNKIMQLEKKASLLYDYSTNLNTNNFELEHKIFPIIK